MIKTEMWHVVCFFIGIILLLIGLWMYSSAFTVADASTASQRKTWSFVLFIIGFFLLLLCAACGDQLKAWSAKKMM